MIINAEMFRNSPHRDATNPHLGRFSGDALVHGHRGQPDEVRLEQQPGQSANVAYRVGDAMRTIELWKTEPTGQDVRELARRLAKAGTGLIIEFKQGS